MRLRSLVSSGGVLLLAIATLGCASAKPKLLYLTDARWREEIRARGVDPDSVPNPLLVTAPMRQTAKALAGIGSPDDQLRSLQRGLFDPEAFLFHYDSSDTLTAAETFERREGNCLSFTNLFVALARSIGLPVTTALVKRPSESEREGDLMVVVSHVVATAGWNIRPVFFDFDRRSHESFTTFEPLNDIWITALYLNNRGADELRSARPDLALRHLTSAVKLAPEFAPAWGNMGVAQRRLGKTSQALDAYRHALAIDPGEPTILSNLAVLYRSLGREMEADAAVAAANLSKASPYVLIVRGDVEFAGGRYREAMSFYKRAHRAGPKLADPWIAMAKVVAAEKRIEKARRYLSKAVLLEPNNEEALAMLRALDANPSVHAREE
jgi:tetratricopeptide (TPR) repeat protein